MEKVGVGGAERSQTGSASLPFHLFGFRSLLRLSSYTGFMVRMLECVTVRL